MTRPSDFALSRKVQLNRGLSVEITVGAGGRVVCEWSPAAPPSLTRKERAAYRAARDSLLAELAARTGIGIVVLEL